MGDDISEKRKKKKERKISMKTCQNCGKDNPDSAKFCRYCGRGLNPGKPLKTKKAPRSRKHKILLACVGLISLMAVVSQLFSYLPDRSGSGTDYQERMDMAEKYLFDLDYEKAEEYYLEARTIDPKQSEPYEQLYRIYTIREEPLKAEEIHDEAVQNLGEGDRIHFERIAAVIAEDEKPDPKRQTVTELGKLDLPPVSLDQKAWLLVKDGKYSFLKPDGTIQDASASREISLFGVNDSSGNLKSLTACMPTGEFTDMMAYIDGNYGSVPACGGGGPVTNFPHILNENLELDFAPAAQYWVETNGSEFFKVTEPIVVSQQENSKGEYYIYNADGNLYGPYKETETSAFQKIFESIPGAFPYGQNAMSPFWIRNESAGSEAEGIQNLYSVISRSGKKSKDGFSNAIAIDPFSIGVYKSNRFYLLDENLEPLYDGLYEAGAYPIDGMAPVKTEGTWKLVSLDPSRKIKAPAEGEPEEKEEKKEKEPDSKKPEYAFQNLTGRFGIHGSRWSGILEIDEDGFVNGSGHVFYSHDTGDGYPNGSADATEYTAQLVPVSFDESGTPDRFRLTNVSYIRQPGTEEIIDGVRYTYSEASAYGGHEDDDYVVYPPGTSYADLPPESLQWLRVSANDGSINDYIFIYKDNGAYSRLIEP